MYVIISIKKLLCLYVFIYLILLCISGIRFCRAMIFEHCSVQQMINQSWNRFLQLSFSLFESNSVFAILMYLLMYLTIWPISNLDLSLSSNQLCEVNLSFICKDILEKWDFYGTYFMLDPISSIVFPRIDSIDFDIEFDFEIEFSWTRYRNNLLIDRIKLSLSRYRN